MKTLYKEFEFNYASFRMLPYKGNDGDSSRLLKDIILKLREKDFPNDKRVIDRFAKRKNHPKRELVIISIHYDDGGRRCFGKLALIKNKAPLLWGSGDIVEEIEKEEFKKFIEVTNFAINFSDKGDPVVMLEYNNEGPRLSDFEFYIRQIARDFKIAKNIYYILHLNIDYTQLDKEISDIFYISAKVRSATANNNSNWLFGLKHMGSETGFKDVRLEFFYNRPKKKEIKPIKNDKGLSFAKKIITWLKKDNNNIDNLEDLKMTYEVNDQDIVDLDFIKNKVISLIRVQYLPGKAYQNKDFKFEVGQEFNKYLNTGIPTSEIPKT